MYNHVSEGSEIKGWSVTSENAKNQKGRKHYNVCLDGVEKGIRLALDRNKYEPLTQVDAGKVYPAINVFTKLYSIYLGADKYLPIVTLAENAEENQNIVLLNYETNAGEVIAGLDFINLIPISHYITNKDFKSRITLAAVDIDNTKDYGVRIKYGFNNGRILEVEQIMFSNYGSMVEAAKKNSLNQQTNIFKSVETIEKIESSRLNIPRMDLSDICINPQ